MQLNASKKIASWWKRGKIPNIELTPPNPNPISTNTSSAEYKNILDSPFSCSYHNFFLLYALRYFFRIFFKENGNYTNTIRAEKTKKPSRCTKKCFCTPNSTLIFQADKKTVCVHSMEGTVSLSLCINFFPNEDV